MGRFLGVDYGIRRTGTSVGDTVTRVAVPLGVIDGRNDISRDARNIADLGLAQKVDVFVVGIPISMNDGESEQTALTRRFAAELARLSGREVVLQDERLSSYAAQEALDAAGIARRRQKGRRDAIAAQQILQSYLDGLPTSG